ncbi:transient receptor potential cation channel subfamily A member 1 homolog isoform X2 [Branchiostoma floridae x Branchiostoma belcheri]
MSRPSTGGSGNRVTPGEVSPELPPVEIVYPSAVPGAWTANNMSGSYTLTGDLAGMENGAMELQESPGKPSVVDIDDPKPPGPEREADGGLRRWESAEALNVSLHQAARDGDEEVMMKILSRFSGNAKRRKINELDEEKLCPLHYAARNNDYQMVKLLVENGANVNRKGEDDTRAIHFAARFRKLKREQSEEQINEAALTQQNSVIQYLVSQGVHVNEKDYYGQTALHFACIRDNVTAAQDLLRCEGINVEAKDKQEMTALHLCAIHESNEIGALLISAGANLRACEEELLTPLHFACQSGNLELAQMLFTAAEKLDGWVTISQMVTDQDNDENTCLHMAVDNGHLELVQLCLEKGADVNRPRTNFATPLHLACVSGNLDIVKLLLEHNARSNALNISQEAPIHKAASYNHAHVVKYLLEKGAQIDRREKDNFTPLLLAASEGHVETIQMLLDNNANIAAVDKYDKTALYWAAQEDRLDALQVLLEHPLAMSLLEESDRYDNTPLHISAEKGYLGCVKALLDKGAFIDTKNEEEQMALHLAAKSGRTKVVRELVKRDKTIINGEDENSCTPLHLASIAGHTKVVQVLLEAGANIEARNTNGWTPLDCAAAEGWTKTAMALLDDDSPVDPTDKAKTTPLHLASSRGHVEMVELLLKWNANLALKNDAGLNCLDLAIDNGHKDVAAAIVNDENWEMAMRNKTTDHSGMATTPMRKLIRKMPSVAELVFNKCTTSNGLNPEHRKYEITFNYEFLDDMYAPWLQDMDSEKMSIMSGESNEIYDKEHFLKEDVQAYTTDSNVLKKNHPLQIMVISKREHLLAHPLSTSLLRHKWTKYGRYIYYFSLIIYLVFLTFLTGYLVTVRPPYVDTADNATQASWERWSTNNSAVILVFSVIGKFIILGLAAFHIIKEVVQMFVQRMDYLTVENLLEWALYVLSVLFVIDLKAEDWLSSTQPMKENWQWEVGAVAIFLAWMDLILFIRKFPRFGIYVVMFTDILTTFLKFAVVLLLFVVAFGLCFYALISNQFSFRTVEVSLVKILVMMIGEFDFDSIFHTFEDKGDAAEYADQLFYGPVTYIIFVVFVIIGSIIIMNLLVGLAVDDIKGVQEEAVLERLAMQVDLTLDVEQNLPEFIRKRFVRKQETMKPNAIHTSALKAWLFSDSATSAQAIAKALNPEKTEIEKLQEQQEDLMEVVNELRYRVKNMKYQNDRLEELLVALVDQAGLQVDEEDKIEFEVNWRRHQRFNPLTSVFHANMFRSKRTAHNNV